MNLFIDNKKQLEIGLKGEEIIRQWFIGKKIPFMQVDIMWKHNNKWYLGEIKTQEKYLAPPFDGHGMPKWQVDRRLEFQNDTGIQTYLIVYDLEEKCIFTQALSNLMQGDNYQTKGIKPRIIFPLNSFKKIII